ncbi:hypothetical protein HPB52_001000 [Rhipicephalus sanguineus]|uniref:GH18 domain-containing protein n=1 Tax=Rhipicephalus sanguineus TaxID=34632 RepID=A0A9D4SMN2_RHISA|nr:hypothetical protein HPB52_001000 [Rhipicephalus sanguineus]
MAVPVMYPSPQYEMESPATPGIVKTPPTRVLRSLFPATDVVQRPVLRPGSEPSPPTLARSPVTSPRHMNEPHSSAESPMEVVSPQGSRVGYSFDSDETEPYAVQENRPWWQLLWMLCSLVFITVFIPTAVFLITYQSTGRAPPTFIVVAGVATSVNVTSSALRTSQTTTDLPRVTFDPVEGFLLQPGESVQDFCKRQMERDRSPMPPPGRLPTTMIPNSTTKDIQLRPVICVFNTKYWRLQDAYLPTLMPLHYCSALLWYGYAVHALNGTIVWKYRTAFRYLNALLNMKFQHRLLHRGYNISVYFALGGAREDSANLSYAAGDPGTRRRLAKAVWDKVEDVLTPWTGVNVDWNYPGDPCNPGSGTGNLFFELIKELKNYGTGVMISIPPVKSRLSAYSLQAVVSMVDYIIIKTHTAFPSLRNVVRCSGDHRVAADVFNAALALLPTWDDKLRLGYSISVAPETFLAPVAQLGAPALGTKQWDNYTRQPGRTSYASVCRETPVIRTSSHPLCLMVARQIDSQTVATFSDEQAIMERMNLTYSDNMAMAPVAVFDIDLDDFTGKCGNGPSPLIRAVAIGPG